MVLSLSSSGNYAISTDMSRHAVLWNIKDKTYKILDSKVNVYSAYFIKNSNNLMYQDDTNNKVMVMNIRGEIITKLNPGFPTYNQAITSNLKTYIGVDDNDQIFLIQNGKKRHIFYYYCGPDYHKPAPPKGMPYDCGSFIGDMKLFNIALSPNEKFFSTSGFTDLFLWDTKAGKLLRHSQKNNAQTFATISPDNKYIISGDVANRGLRIPLSGKTYKKFFYQTPTHSNIKEYLSDGWRNSINNLVTIKFITKDKILAIYKGIPKSFNYATLYSPKDLTPFPSKDPHVWAKRQLLPIKYLPLLTLNNPDQPHPATQSFVRDQAIDTSPSAHILVMAQAHNNGILVYKYNPKTQTLKQIWAPVIKTPWWHIW